MELIATLPIYAPAKPEPDVLASCTFASLLYTPNTRAAGRPDNAVEVSSPSLNHDTQACPYAPSLNYNPSSYPFKSHVHVDNTRYLSAGTYKALDAEPSDDEESPQTLILSLKPKP